MWVAEKIKDATMSLACQPMPTRFDAMFGPASETPEMTKRPIHHYWPLFIAFPMFLSFALYNVYCAFAYGEMIASRIGDGWISFGNRPIWFSIMLIVYIVMAVIFGAALVKVIQFMLIRLRWL
jgi:hypothetical protein